MGSIGLGSSDADALLARRDWADLSRRLTLHAFKRLRRKSPELAEEFAQTAIESVLSAKRAPWDPTRQPDLFAHLGSIVNSLVSHHFANSATRAQRGAMHEAERLPASDESAEADLVSKDFAARVAKKLRERVREKKDTVNVKLLELMAGGLEKPLDLAEAADVPVEAIYKAKDRLNDHLAAVKIELGWEDGDGQ